MFGLRLGDDPRVVVTTTPKPIRIIRELIADPTTVITRGSTYDNRFNLPAAFLAQIVKKYEGTHTHGVPARGTGWLCPYGR
jgi:phage terminase large subunit-like protein